MNKQLDEPTIIDLLDAHADRLNTGLSGPSAFSPAPGGDLEVLRSLMRLAERIAQVLAPVEPSPVFIASLELELGRAAFHPQQSLFNRYRKTNLVTLAAAGSALSVTSVILLYFMRFRPATRTSHAS